MTRRTLAVLALLSAATAARADQDIGLRVNDGSGVKAVAVEPGGSSSLKIRKGSQTYGVILVPPGSPGATRARVAVAGGSVMAMKEYSSAKWYQANKQVCPTFCSGLGLTNVASPDGHWCVSGENNAYGARGVIVWTYGIWKFYREGTGTGKSVGGRCYQSKQKRDNDVTDWTVGCYCR